MNMIWTMTYVRFNSYRYDFLDCLFIFDNNCFLKNEKYDSPCYFCKKSTKQRKLKIYKTGI